MIVFLNRSTRSDIGSAKPTKHLPTREEGTRDEATKEALAAQRMSVFTSLGDRSPGIPIISIPLFDVLLLLILSQSNLVVTTITASA